MARKVKLVAEICLYGNSAVGAGWLVRMHDGRMLGDGAPKAGRSNTEAVWLAVDAIRTAMPAPLFATARVYAPSGCLCADVDLRHVGYYGDLKWLPAAVYAISAAEIEAASVKA